MTPLAVDLYCGKGGWCKGLIAAGWRVVGFDIAADLVRGYPGEAVLQDVLTIHGSQFRHADLIVASPPCQEFSYMAMPWSRAKQIAAALRGQGEFPDGYKGSRTITDLTALFDACFRIQREASAAAGRYIPMVVENVKGAQPWVGRANANYGSFYLWGNVLQVGRRITVGHLRPRIGEYLVAPGRAGGKMNPDGTSHGQGSWFAVADSKNRGSGGVKVAGLDWSKHGTEGYERMGRCGAWAAQARMMAEFNGHDHPARGRQTKNGSWFAIGSNGKSNLVDDGRKVGMNFHEHEKTGEPGRSLQGAAVADMDNGTKGGGDWFSSGEGCSLQRRQSSKSNARREASALIAMIPFPLAKWVGEAFHPCKP